VRENHTTTGRIGEAEPCGALQGRSTVLVHQGGGAVGYAPVPLLYGAYLTAHQHNCEGGVLQQYYRDGRLLRGRGLPRIGGGRRGSIWGLSDASARRLIFAAKNHPDPWLVWWRAGYPSEFPMDGKVCKRHLDRLLKRFRRAFPDGSYLWVQEWQERGALHYHGLFDVEIEGDWLAKAWYEIVGSGDENHLYYGTKSGLVYDEHGVVMYLSKYLSKRDQKEAPPGFKHVGRFWGCSMGVAPLFAAWALDAEGCEDATRYMRRFKAGQYRRRRVFGGMDGWTAYDAGWHVGRIGDAMGVPLEHIGR
jgi:hypothetical protein